MRFPRGTYAVVACLAAALGLALLAREFLRRDEPTRLPATAPVARVLYDTHCAVCHGATGKGDGPGAPVLRQSIPDFADATVMRTVTDRFLFEIIKKGSSQFGRSNAMPSWGMRLSDEQIQALVVYIRSFAPSASPGSSGRKETP